MAQRLIYPRELDNKEIHPATIRFGFFEREDVTRSTPGDEIQLYMPESASQPSTVSWDSEKFGAIGSAIASIGRGAAGADPGSVISSAMSSAASLPGAAFSRALANIGSGAASLLGGNVSAEGLMGETMGKIPNPYLTMVFRGVDFRSFAFVFKFTPYSESDCDTIDNIIRAFRRNALPTKEGAFLKYPSECDIEYFWRGAENKWLHRFKKAVCTAVDVDYTGAGMFSTMRNGFPSTIVLTTKWSEIEIVTRDDIDRNGAEGGY